MDDRKITLVQSHPVNEEWWRRVREHHRIVMVPSSRLLLASLDAGITQLDQDIERVVFDRAVDSCEYLSFLAALPAEFPGDVLVIRPDGSGFLSSTSRGAGRHLYTLRESDVDFYLQIHFDAPHVSAPTAFLRSVASMR